MFAEVIPFKRLPNTTRTFTYRVPSQLDGALSIGQFIEIPWRKGQTYGVIASFTNNAGNLKRISKIKAVVEEKPSWSKARINTIFYLAELYHSSPASIALGFAPEIPLRNFKVDQPSPSTIKDLPQFDDIFRVQNLSPESSIIEYHSLTERMKTMSELIETCEGRVLIMTPHAIETKEIFQYISDNHSNKVILWDNSLNKNQQWILWNEIKKNGDIVIATRSGFMAPLTNINSIIIDQEDSPDHKSWEAAPHFDIRIGAEYLCKEMNVPLYFLSRSPRLQTTFPLISSSVSAAAVQSVFHDKSKSLLHPLVNDAILDSLANNLSPIIIAPTKSKARTLYCLDCHHQWSCPRCFTSLHLHEKSLNCSICDYSEASPPVCSECKGRRIRAYGLGLAGLAETLPQGYPDAQIKIITAETIDSLCESDSGIFLLSPNLLKRLYYQFPAKKVGSIIYYNPESLLYRPDFHSGELFYQTIQWHRGIAYDYFNQNLVIQTSLADNDTELLLAAKGSFSDFRKKELPIRRRFKYPPFSRIISVEIKNDHDDFQNMVETISNRLGSINNDSYQVHGPKYRYRKNSKIKAFWTIKQLIPTPPPLDKTLESLYSSITIDISPE